MMQEGHVIYIHISRMYFMYWYAMPAGPSDDDPCSGSSCWNLNALTCHSTATRSRSTIRLWKVLVMLPLSATLWKVQSCPTDLSGSVAAPSHGANPQCCRRQTLRAQGAADQLNLVMKPMEIGIQLLKYCLNIITSKSFKFQLPNRFSCTKHPSKTLRQC